MTRKEKQEMEPAWHGNAITFIRNRYKNGYPCQLIQDFLKSKGVYISRKDITEIIDEQFPC